MNQSITKHIAGTLPDVFSKTVEHPEFMRVLELLWSKVVNPGPTRLFFVTGPTGIGKTTLASALADRLHLYFGKELEADPHRALFGSCAIKAPGPFAFSWKYTYLQLLRSLEFPFTEHPNLLVQARRRDEQMRFLPDPAPEKRMHRSHDVLFGALLETIRWRAPKVILLDEAQHLVRLHTKVSLRHQVDHLKYLADEARTLFVLFSSYELTNLVDFDGQVIRRSESVRFNRYIFRDDLADPAESIRGFAVALNNFTTALGAVLAVELLDHVAELYAGSLGCIGLLRDWLGRAYGANGKGRITLVDLRKTVLSVRLRTQLLGEAEAGEKVLNEDRTADVLWERLRLPVARPEANSETAPVEKPRRRVGRRKPHSDPVGLPAIEALHQTL